MRVRRRASTYRQYKSLLTAHLFPSLGQKPLKAVQTKHLDELYRALEREGRRPGYGRKGAAADAQPGLAPKSIRGLHVAVHSGFERAVRHRLIARNPADGAELPGAAARRELPVGVADVQKLLATATAQAARRRGAPPAGRPRSGRRCGRSWPTPACGSARRSGCAGPTSTSRPAGSGSPATSTAACTAPSWARRRRPPARGTCP